MGRAALWLAAAGVFIALGYTSYRSGAMLARLELKGLEDDIARLTSQSEGLRVENDRLRSDLAQARQASDGMKRRYDTDIPSGGLATLLALTRDRLGAGVREDRIAQVLRDAENTRPCEGRITRKRFPIQTAGQPEDSVSLLEGLIQVSASAPPNAEDPAKAATVTIARVWSVQPIKATGLPVRQSIALNNVELKLLIEPSDLRGYAAVSLSLCGRG